MRSYKMLVSAMLAAGIVAGIGSMNVLADEITFTDDAGREITLEKPLEKVVVFNKFNSEIIRAVGKVDNFFVFVYFML